VDNEDVDAAAQGLSRRSVLKKSAIAGGAIIWAAPVVQTLGQGVASATPIAPGANGSDRCAARAITNLIDLGIGAGGTVDTLTFNTQPTGDCGDCDVPINGQVLTWTILNASPYGTFNFALDYPTASGNKIDGHILNLTKVPNQRNSSNGALFSEIYKYDETSTSGQSAIVAGNTAANIAAQNANRVTIGSLTYWLTARIDIEARYTITCPDGICQTATHAERFWIAKRNSGANTATTIPSTGIQLAVFKGTPSGPVSSYDVGGGGQLYDTDGVPC
jgi:hypothetical protein